MTTWIFESDESFEEMVERVARTWHERPCPPEEGHCNPDLHVWEKANPEDKQWCRDIATVMLTELGFS